MGSRVRLAFVYLLPLVLFGAGLASLAGSFRMELLVEADVRGGSIVSHGKFQRHSSSTAELAGSMLVASAVTAMPWVVARQISARAWKSQLPAFLVLTVVVVRFHAPDVTQGTERASATSVRYYFEQWMFASDADPWGFWISIAIVTGMIAIASWLLSDATRRLMAAEVA